MGQVVSVPAVAAALVLNLFQLREVTRQTKAVNASLKQNAYHALLASRIDLAGVFLANDPEVIAWHLAGRGYDVATSDDAKRVLFALLRINAHQTNYLSYAAGRVSGCVWEAWRADAVADFSVLEYKKLWPIAKKFYTSDFVTFIDEILTEGARGTD